MCAAIVVAFRGDGGGRVRVVQYAAFWRSLAASGDSAAAYNVLGPGLERTDEGLLKVTDPTQAYMQVDADGSSEYVRMDPVSSKALDKAARQSEQVLRTVRVRPDVNRRAGTVNSVSVSSPRSLYVHAAAAGGSVCVRIVEPKGSLIPFDAVRAKCACTVRVESVAYRRDGGRVGDGTGVEAWFAVVADAVGYDECEAACVAGGAAGGACCGHLCRCGVAAGGGGSVELPYERHVHV